VGMLNLDPKIIAAIIAAATSIITLILSAIGKSLFERHFHIFKLEADHRYEQRKRIKKILSRNKIQLLNSCESLTHRLWNFAENYREHWHRLDGNYSKAEHNYYFLSSLYRILSVFAWIRKIENEMIYLDTTISTKEDLNFIKYLKVLPQLFCDLLLFDGFEYDKNYDTDHFFKNNFEQMAACLLNENGVTDFSDFKKNFSEYRKKVDSMCNFIDDLSPDEERLRWDRLQAFHLVLMAFINSFGYDFQYTPKHKIDTLISTNRKTRLVNNLIVLLKRDKLYRQREIKRVIKVITRQWRPIFELD
jgi:hypothetical protein